MRFCMVTTFYPPYSFGGDATYVRALARKLVELGHEVEVVASSDAFAVRGKLPSEPSAETDDGVLVHRLKSEAGLLAPLLVQQSGRPMLYTRELNRLLGNRFDVIHFHNISLVGGPAILAMGQARLRLFSIHEHWLICPTHILWKNRSRACDKPTCLGCSIRSGIPPQLWRYTGLRDRALQHVDCLLAPSEFTANKHKRAGIDRPMRVLPLFSCLEPSRSPRARPDEPATFIFCGRVTASKGVEQLLRVCAAIPDIRVKVIGTGDLEPILASRYRGDNRIQFLGQVPQEELIAHYSSARALVLPSIAPETFGLTVVEAAACGTPAIVSHGAGGAVELIERSGGGLVYDGDAELATAIERLKNDHILHAELARKARDSYLRDYTADGHVTAYLDLIEEQLGERPQAPVIAACAQ